MTLISPQASALSRSTLAQHIMLAIEDTSRGAVGAYLHRQGSFAPSDRETTSWCGKPFRVSDFRPASPLRCSRSLTGGGA
jgi:hypothetical protein